MATRVHRGSRKQLADALERLGYRTLELVELSTGEACLRAGSDPLAVRLIRWGAMACRVSMVEAVETLLAGGELRTRAYLWRLA